MPNGMRPVAGGARRIRLANVRFLLWCIPTMALAWLCGLLPAQAEGPYGPSTGGEVVFQERFNQQLSTKGWHPVTRWGGSVQSARWAVKQGRRGSGCLLLVGEGQKVGWEKSAVRAIPGAFYEIRGWLQADLSGEGALLGVAFANSKGEIIGELQSEKVTKAADWKCISAFGTAPADAALVSFFCLAEGKGQALFDDVSAFVSVPPKLQLTSCELPESIPYGDQVVVKLALVATTDISTYPSLVALISQPDSEGTIVRFYQRLVKPGETWHKDQVKEMEIAVSDAAHCYLPGRYLLRLELRNAVWSGANGYMQREFEVLPKPPAKPTPSLALPIYEGPKEAKAGQKLEFSLLFSSPLELPPAKAFAWLCRGDELWSAASFAFPGGNGEIRLEKLAFAVPSSIPAGDYDLQVGVVGVKVEGKTPQDRFIATISIGPEAGNDTPLTPGGSSTEPSATGPTPPPPLGRPLAHGFFADSSSLPHFWWVNQHSTLFWDAEPYFPLGAACSPTFLQAFSPEQGPRNEANWQLFADYLTNLSSLGISDLLIIPGRPLTEIPTAALQKVVDELELQGFHYGIELNAGPQQPLKGFWVDSGVILREVTPGLDYTTPPSALSLPEKAKALYIALDPRKSEVLDAGQIRLPEEPALASQGRFVFRLNKPDATNATVFFTPQVQLDAASPAQNLWEGFEDSVQQICRHLAAIRFGPGLRFLLDPLRPGLSYKFFQVIPDSKDFLEEYSDWLKSKFGSTTALEERWAVSGGSLASFSEAAGLVPTGNVGDTAFFLCDGDEGPANLSPKENSKRFRVLKMDLTRSSWWLDWLDFRDQSVADKLRNLSSRIKDVVDVPVVVSQNLATAAYTVCWDTGAGGIDGVASRLQNLPQDVRQDDTIAAYGAARQSAKSLWCLATVRSLEPLSPPLGDNVPPEASPSGQEIKFASAEILSCGAKGTFLHFLTPDDAAPSDRRLIQTDALKSLSDLRLKVHSAANPLAEYGPPLCYWLPPLRPEESIFSPSAQTFLSTEDVWTGGASLLVRGRWIVPAWRVPEDSSPMILIPSSLPSAVEYSPLLAEALQQMHRPRAYVGNLTLPEGLEELQKYFSGHIEPDSDGTLVQALTPTPSSEIFARTPSGDVWHLLDGALEIVSKPAHPWLAGGGGDDSQAGLLRIFDISPQERYYSPEEFGREFLGLP